ncbi:MAG TPA: sulfite exporter TauE/SafE family protein [bacterium]|jgi:uncharacterized membrane protein YfcA
MIHFPISGVETQWWLPLLFGIAVSTFTSTGGISGAFLLLPFQVSILGFTGPSVTPTNLIFNIVAIPSGVYRYWKEKRMVWSLVWATMLGTLPGIILGAFIRIHFLQDPRAFKLFVGLVLLYIGGRLATDVLKKPIISGQPASSSFQVTNQSFNLRQVRYEFEGVCYFAPTWGILLLSFIVGIVGGTYGIGGGAIISPFFVAVFKLPVHTVAGAALFGTFVTSIAGVIFYTIIAPFYAHTGLAITPDWLLGAMFGVSGAVGMYIGARLQRKLPARTIKTMLVVCLLFVSIRYIIEFLSPLF